MIVAAEARGFIRRSARRGVGLALCRFANRASCRSTRTPSNTNWKYAWGDSTLEMHIDGVQPGQRVLVVDDLLATGGNRAAGRLIRSRATIVGAVAMSWSPWAASTQVLN